MNRKVEMILRRRVMDRKDHSLVMIFDSYGKGHPTHCRCCLVSHAQPVAVSAVQISWAFSDNDSFQALKHHCLTSWRDVGPERSFRLSPSRVLNCLKISLFPFLVIIFFLPPS